jgi:signal transduction histidine kinase
LNGDQGQIGESGAANLRPRARIMRTLGDELISSEMVAVIELVKNAYDADATRVLVRLREPLEPDEGGIDVMDDGHGMALDTVLGAYLEPATSFRRDNVRSEELGRAVTGEKGIGRFAVSRLANELELVSRRPGEEAETRVLFDWRRFDDPDAYLDQVDLVWEREEPRDIAPGGLVEALWADGPPLVGRLERGTILKMRGLRAHWGRDELEELRTGLSRLISPFHYESEIERADRFSIRMEAPEAFADLSGTIEPPESLQSPHYVLKGKVEKDGSFDLTIRLRGQTEPIRRRAKTRFEDHEPRSGPFDVELRVWDRDRIAMEELGQRVGRSTTEVRRDLDRAAGVSVYRDGFRVLPYGEPGNDWLNLDARRVQNPTMRLSNNQIVGFVLTSQEANPGLRDQTNREGLIHDQAYDDLIVQLRTIISELEDLRYQARRADSEPTPRPGQGALFAGFDLSPVRDYVTEKYPQDRDLAGLVGAVQQTIEQDVQRAQDIIVRYRRLATLGQLIDKVLHDGRAPLAKMGNQAMLGLRSIDRRKAADCEDLVGGLGEKLNTIRTQHDVLATVFRRIEPFGGRRRGRPAEVTVEEIVADAVGVLESDVQRVGAKVMLPTTETKVTVDRAELQEVLVNLIDNSLYWLGEVPEDERRISVAVERTADGEVTVLLSDSGPGVPEDAQEHIFDPYYSRKPDGVGLGLSIAGEIVDEYYGGDLELLADGPMPGATFRITLRRRV